MDRRANQLMSWAAANLGFLLFGAGGGVNCADFIGGWLV